MKAQKAKQRQKRALKRRQRRARRRKERKSVSLPDRDDECDDVISVMPKRKISETLIDFAEPLLDVLPHDASMADVENTLAFVHLAWDCAVLDAIGDTRPEGWQEMISGYEPVFEKLLRRKRALFAHDQRIILSFSVAPKPGGFHLTAMGLTARRSLTQRAPANRGVQIR